MMDEIRKIIATYLLHAMIKIWPAKTQKDIPVIKAMQAVAVAMFIEAGGNFNDN
jgi:hypothetical protein